MRKSPKKCAPTPKFVSQNQLVFEGFESPFEKKLNPENRWIILAKLIPWMRFAIFTLMQFLKHNWSPLFKSEDVLGSIIINHLCDIDNRETVAQILENIYMQYFLVYSSFSDEPPFDASLFVTFRKHSNFRCCQYNYRENWCYKD
jgi:hypothetical protein